MKTTLCQSMSDVEKAYYYPKAPPVPEKFPCLMIEFDEAGGLGGPYRYYRFEYPDEAHVEAWVNGFNACIKYVD